MPITSRLITFEDSLDLPENRFEEIVRGESRVMPPPTRSHEFLLRVLARSLDRQVDDKRFAVFGSGLGIGIRRAPYLTYRIPDLTVYDVAALRQEEKSSRDPYVWVPPILLVECLSPANRKGAVAELLADYELIAVPEVWTLIPEDRRLVVHLQQEASKYHTGRVAVASLPGVEVDLDELWRAFHDGP